MMAYVGNKIMRHTVLELILIISKEKQVRNFWTKFGN